MVPLYPKSGMYTVSPTKWRRPSIQRLSFRAEMMENLISLAVVKEGVTKFNTKSNSISWSSNILRNWISIS